MSDEILPSPLSERCSALLSDSLYLTLTSKQDGFSLTYQEASTLLEYLYQHRDLFYAATHQRPETLPAWAQPAEEPDD